MSAREDLQTEITRLALDVPDDLDDRELACEVLARLGVDVSRRQPEDAGKALSDRILWFMQRLKTPNGLRALGYSAADIPRLPGNRAQQRQ